MTDKTLQFECGGCGLHTVNSETFSQKTPEKTWIVVVFNFKNPKVTGARAKFPGNTCPACTPGTCSCPEVMILENL